MVVKSTVTAAVMSVFWETDWPAGILTGVAGAAPAPDCPCWRLAPAQTGAEARRVRATRLQKTTLRISFSFFFKAHTTDFPPFPITRAFTLVFIERIFIADRENSQADSSKIPKRL
jgi:hypothetical protein